MIVNRISLFSFGVIVSCLFFVVLFVSHQALAAPVSTGDCVNDCIDTRDSCVSRFQNAKSQCDMACKEKFGQLWDFNRCLDRTNEVFRACKDSVDRYTDTPFYIKIFLTKETVEDCIDAFSKAQESCRETSKDYNDCVGSCAEQNQKGFNECLDAFQACADKCPNVCETNADCKLGEICKPVSGEFYNQCVAENSETNPSNNPTTPNTPEIGTPTGLFGITGKAITDALKKPGGILALLALLALILLLLYFTVFRKKKA